MLFCYEAGPCGYEVYRLLTAVGQDCLVVVAPSLIPKKASDRVKTDRRDALSLARLLRAGELTAVWVPDQEQEAMRDLTRAREDFKAAERRARQRLGAFLLRHGLTYTCGKSKWTLAHRRPLESLKLESPMELGGVLAMAGTTLDSRARQLHDEDRSGGTQPTNIRVINRRR